MKKILVMLLFLALPVHADEWNLGIEPETPEEEGYYMMIRPCLEHLAYLQSRVSLLPEEVHYQHLEDWLGEEMKPGATEMAEAIREGHWREGRNPSWSKRILRWSQFSLECQKDMRVMFRERLIEAIDSIDEAGNLLK